MHVACVGKRKSARFSLLLKVFNGGDRHTWGYAIFQAPVPHCTEKVSDSKKLFIQAILFPLLRLSSSEVLHQSHKMLFQQKTFSNKLKLCPFNGIEFFQPAFQKRPTNWLKYCQLYRNPLNGSEGSSPNYSFQK
jgi:hypothetical protein